MAKVRIGSKIVRIGDDNYQPTMEDIEEVAAAIYPEQKAEAPKEKSEGSQLMKSFAIGGAPGFGVTPGSEEALPMAGQTVGSVMGGFPGSVAGATAGQAARQGVRALRGKGFQFGEIPMEAARTATMEGAFRGLGKVAPWAANKTMNWVLRPGSEALEKNPNFGLDALKLGLRGTYGQMAKKATSITDDLEQKVQSLIKGNPKTIATKNIVKELDPIVERKLNIGDPSALSEGDDVLDVADAVTKRGPSISLEDANKLKRDLYADLPKSAYKPNAKISDATSLARKKVASGIVSEMDQAVPGLKPINKDYGIAIESRQAIPKAKALRERQTPLPYFEVGGGLLGLASGQPWIPAAILARRLLSTPFGASYAAKGLQLAGSKAATGGGSVVMAELLRKLSER